MSIPPSIFIEAISLPDAWQKAIYQTIHTGANIEYNGIKFKDVNSLIVIKYPLERPYLHPQFPTKDIFLEEYCNTFTRTYVETHNLLPEEKQFNYTYMDRLINYSGELEHTYSFDQIATMKSKLEGDAYSRQIQAITWNPVVDNISQNPPCLQRILIRKLSANECEVHFMWRSRDLFKAWNSNLVGLLRMLHTEILNPLDLKLVKVVDFCNSLHIYEEDFEAASKIRPIGTNPQLVI